jgi:uncharacterized phage protein gp47/JayE
MAINIRGYNQILGDMIRKIIADTPLNDVNTGSALLTLLEAAAQIDFENNASILSVLELLSIDAVRNNDLDARAADYGLSRRPAQRATGFVTIFDTSISKRSTGLYQVKPAPIAGSTQIFVNDASAWSPTGQLFIGRGTPNFEGPIAYTSIVNNGSFFTINLGSALEKDHLISDVVVDAQGTTDRLINAGTVVQIPANNQNPTIEFRTLRDAIIPAGEDTISQVEIVSVLAGVKNNAGINTITQFGALPFPGASVTNTTALTSGRDVETDAELRERIKAYANTLARGTEQAILTAIIGVSSAEDGKQVASAVITEPPRIGDPSILYVDDGGVFQPSFAGQSVDVLLNEASGNEEFLQLANYPLPRPQSINTVDGPFVLTNGMQLRVLVDGVEEAVTFSTSQFANIAAATVAEVIIAINDQAQTFKATFTDNLSRILLFPAAHDVELIQVSPLRASDSAALFANNVLKFPTNEFSYIRLYQNNTLLNEKEKSATLLTNTFPTWNITTAGNLIIAVDGTPPQNRSFSTADFGGSPFAALTLSDWVAAVNSKFAGITATATSSGRMQIVSNKDGAESSLEIIGGDYFDKMFSDQDVFAQGKNSDFQLNRQNGNLRILRDIEEGDLITAGTEDAKGNLVSEVTQTGAYNVSTDGSSRPAQLVVVADSDEVTPRVGVGLAIGNVITVTDEGNSVMRLTSDSASSFAAILPGDFLFIASRGALSTWIDPANAGLFKVISKGEHVNPGVDTYVEVKNVNIVTGSHPVEASEDIQAFKADTYPQLWKGTFVATPASAPIQDIVDSFNENIINAKSSVFKTNSVKLTSTTEEGGSIAIGAGSGNALVLFDISEEQKGNPSHIASKTLSKDLAAFFKRTEPTSTDADGVSGKTVWLDRVTYSDIKGDLTADAEPGEEGVDAYSEELESTGVLTPANVDYDDVLNNIEGSNKGHYRSIRDILVGDKIGTQFALPRTVMDYVSGEVFNLMRPVGISSEDSIVFILDQDAVAKTIDIKMSRLGQINNAFPPTDISFSANDSENEAGVTFGTLPVWGKSVNNTEFKDYGVWFRARNWYISGGAGSGGGAFMVRHKEYGPHGESIRFRIDYPSTPNQAAIITHANNPDYSLVTYFFGSGAERPTGEVAGDTFTVTSLGGDQYRLTFLNPIDLSAVLVGDVISMGNNSGVSTSNRGQFRVLAVDDFNKTIDVYNPNGSATFVGNQEVTKVTTIADVVGSPTVSTVSSVLPAAGLDGTYFVIEDSAGLVAVYYDVGTPSPGAGALGVNRVLVVTLTGAESDATVTALTSGVIAADTQFTSSFLGTTITITNVDNGPYAVAADGGVPTGFSFAGTPGTPDISLDGTYFILQDQNGSVAFWYDTTGATSEPLHGADRSIEITTVLPGDSANDVASKTAVVINGDAEFSATALADDITVTDAVNGARPAANAGSSGFTVTQITPGQDDGVETISQPTAFSIFPLIGTAVADIVATVSENPLLVCAEIDGTNDIVLATRDEVYTPAGPSDYSASLAYGHDPDPMSGENSWVRLYDGLSWVKDFDNLDPHFTLKRALTLQGAAPAAYSMESTPNEDSTTGEYFKLVPVTLNNVYHHFTQKALSQLPIVANVDISNNIRRIQVKSKLLGSAGAVEVVGGNANNIEFSIFGEAQVTPGPESSTDFLQVKTRAFPVTLTKGDMVLVENTIAAKRASRLTTADTIDVFKGVGSNVEYRWNPKDTKMGPFVRFDITDASASYSRPAGTVWRWTHNDGGSYFNITDKVVGVVANPPDDEIAAGGVDAANLEIDLVNAGSVSTKQNFRLTVSGVPTQADYYTFESSGGVTFAVWFDVDAVGTAPTGASYVAATNKIEVDILSSDTEDQIVSKLAAELLSNVAFLAVFDAFQEEGANFDDAVEGDLLMAYGTLSGWNSGNKARATGDGNFAGFPIVAIDSVNRYVDVMNPDGVAMANTAIGSGTVAVVPTPIVKWDLKHAAKVDVVQAVKSGTTVTVTTSIQHRLREGDSMDLDDNGLAQTAVVVSVPSPLTFTFTDATALPDGTYPSGNVINSAKTPTRYKIESLGFNSLFRLSHVDGEAPGFVDCGVAVDDVMNIGGSTFVSNNSGSFRVLAVDNSSIIFQNEIAREELDTLVPFNNLDVDVVWTANSDLVTGAVGAFKNLGIGDWVKKVEDTEDKYLQIIALLDGVNAPTTADLAVKIQLGNNYEGTSSTSPGIKFDQNTDVGMGKYLRSTEDIQFFEGDSTMVGDKLFVDRIANNSWFNFVNSGTFEIIETGTTGTDYKPFVRVSNSAGQSQTNRSVGVSLQGFFILEGASRLYKSIRKIERSVIDSFNTDRRSLYMTPATKVDKLSISNGTRVVPLGKMGYSTDIVTGIDGYTYYTGLMREVQRIVDGYEPDSVSYPGRRAVGGFIEPLFPLIRRVVMSLEVTTDEGVNLNEISNDIKSAITNYVNGLGVGEDVILSEVIVRIMDITGVAAVTFNTPLPSTERISVADNEKAFIEPENISVA